MSRFAQTLRQYRSGLLSRKQLLAEIESQLKERPADAEAMLAFLNTEHSGAELPADAYLELTRKIREWPRVWQSGEALLVPSDGAPPLRDADISATVILDDEGHPIGGGSSPYAASAGADPAALIGSVLQRRFKLVGLIGSGGIGSVYKAIDLRKIEARYDDPYVALKLLTLPSLNLPGAAVVLQREAQKLQSLPHPNIVRVIDCDRDGQTVFMTMEYLAGEPLKRRIMEPGFSGLAHDEAVRIIEGVGNALAFAHSHGIVHGDLKPGNVILTDAGEVKVIDFGITRAMTRSDAAKGGERAGERGRLTALTPSYASPEMLENGPADPRDDIYALACIATEILTGHHPFDQNSAIVARDAGMTLKRHAGLSRHQYHALVKALHFERSERTPTVEQFIQELIGARRTSIQRLVAIVVVVSIVAIAAGYLAHRARSGSQAAAGASVPAALARGDVFRDCPTCPLMKVVPPGSFDQGSAADEADGLASEQPQHAVNIAYPLGVGAYEVTVGEFKDFVDATGTEVTGCTVYDGSWRQRAELSWKNPGYPQTATYPVSCVSWLDAQEYVQWLSGKTGQRYRLASASEWEYAARAGTAEARPWDATKTAACASANVADQTAAQQFPGWRVQPCSDGYVYAAPVGSFSPNAFGLNDMLGNVFEWVDDCWRDDYHNAPSDGASVQQADCTEHEARGGSWFTAPPYVRSAYRNRFEQTYRTNSIGFRVVRSLSQ
jgi:formylglycine-generating enzyme required for sulfatase activity